MLLDDLRKQIRVLAALEQSEAPVLSCYIPNDGAARGWRAALNDRLATLERILPATQSRLVNEAAAPVVRYLETSIEPQTRGVAIFSRGGKRPLFIPMQFGAPLPFSVSVRPTPHIYHLVEMKDTYERYVVVLASRRSVRILDVNLGAVTRQLCRTAPQLVRRLSGDWARTHYENRRRDAMPEFIHEQVRILDRLMAAGGHAWLILAGPAQSTAMIEKALPRHLAAKLVGTLAARERETVANIVAASMTAFAQREEIASREYVGRLLGEITRDGLAVAGLSASLAALRMGQAEALLLAAPEAAADGAQASERVPDSAREELVRMAERNGCHVEVVQDSPELVRLGGVGCLLRFRADLGGSVRKRAAGY